MTTAQKFMDDYEIETLEQAYDAIMDGEFLATTDITESQAEQIFDSIVSRMNG